MVKKFVEDIDHGWASIKDNLKRGDGIEIAVGVHEVSANGEGLTIAEYATYNEFGTDKIPSRPFMRTTFDENKAKYSSMIDKIWNAVLTPRASARLLMARLGVMATQDIQNTISGRDFLPKLSEQTIKAKKGSTKTLIDTGAMINSIHHVIRRVK